MMCRRFPSWRTPLWLRLLPVLPAAVAFAGVPAPAVAADDVARVCHVRDASRHTRSDAWRYLRFGQTTARLNIGLACVETTKTADADASPKATDPRDNLRWRFERPAETPEGEAVVDCRGLGVKMVAQPDPVSVPEARLPVANERAILDACATMLDALTDGGVTVTHDPLGDALALSPTGAGASAPGSIANGCGPANVTPGTTGSDDVEPEPEPGPGPDEESELDQFEDDLEAILDASEDTSEVENDPGEGDSPPELPDAEPQDDDDTPPAPDDPRDDDPHPPAPESPDTGGDEPGTGQPVGPDQDPIAPACWELTVFAWECTLMSWQSGACQAFHDRLNNCDRTAMLVDPEAGDPCDKPTVTLEELKNSSWWWRRCGAQIAKVVQGSDFCRQTPLHGEQIDEHQGKPCDPKLVYTESNNPCASDPPPADPEPEQEDFCAEQPEWHGLPGLMCPDLEDDNTPPPGPLPPEHQRPGTDGPGHGQPGRPS